MPAEHNRFQKFPNCPSEEVLPLMGQADLSSIHPDGFAIVHYAARMGRLAAIPVEILDRVLDVVAESGDTPLHIAAANRRIKQVPPNLLRAKRLASLDGDGVPLLHHIAERKALGYIDLDQITPAMLSFRAPSGATVFHRASDAGQLGLLAAHLTVECCLVKNNAGLTPLHLHFGHYQLDSDDALPAQVLTPETLGVEDANGATVLHRGAQRLDLFPPECLTVKALLRKDHDGDTVVHRAAGGGGDGVKHLPRVASEMDVSRLTNKDGATPLHLFSSEYNGQTPPPPAWATAKGYAALDNRRQTPIHKAAESAALRSVPPEFITPQVLTQKDAEGWSPLQRIAASVSQYDFHRDQLHAIPPEALLSLPVFLERLHDEPGTVISLFLSKEYLAAPMEVLLRHGHDPASYDLFVRAGHAPRWPELARPEFRFLAASPLGEEAGLSHPLLAPVLPEAPRRHSARPSTPGL